MEEILLESQRKRCTYCGSEIYMRATICPTCKFSQSKWRNFIVFWGSAASLLAFFSSAVLYSMGELKLFWEDLAWKNDVQVLDFHSFGADKFSLVLSNNSSGAVFVNELVVYYENNSNVTYKIKKYIQARGVISIIAQDFEKNYQQFEGYEANKDGRPDINMISNSGAWSENSPGSDTCYGIDFMNADSEDIFRMNKFYQSSHKKLITYPVDSELVFYDIEHHKMVKESSSIVATYLLSTRSECQKFRRSDPN